MAESMYLLLPRDHGPARWLLVDALGNRIGQVQQGSLGDAAPQAKGRRLTAFAPGEHVTLLHADIPSKSAQKVLQAAPFMLEDRLAEDVESLHFAAAARPSGGYTIFATARERMRHWLDLLSQAGLQPYRLAPDLSGLSPETDAAVVALDGDRALVRLPDGSGFAAEAELALPLLKRRLLDTTSTLKRIVLYAPDAAGTSLASTLSGNGVEVVSRPLPDGTLPLLAAGARTQRLFNLLQGDFQMRSSFQEHWRVWRTTAVLLGVCLMLAIAQQITAYVRLKHQVAALDAQVSQLFSQAMPGSVLHPGNEDLDMKSMLARLQGGSSAGSLLPLLDALGSGLASAPSVQVIGLNYQSGSLQVQLQAPDIGSMDALKATLARQSGISVSLDSVNASGSQVTGRLILAGNPS
ncbi:MAG: type II secretion system protein GspL [Bacillota bacterium]